jgi:hypothetical protein
MFQKAAGHVFPARSKNEAGRKPEQVFATGFENSLRLAIWSSAYHAHSCFPDRDLNNRRNRCNNSSSSNSSKRKP